MDFDGPFEKFAESCMGELTKGSPEWFLCKQAFLGGAAHGITIPPEQFEGIGEALTLAFERCEIDGMAAMMMVLVPEEHRVTLPDGQVVLSEVGVIHLTTALERANPGDAPAIREKRYRIIQAMQKKRADFNESEEDRTDG